MLSYRNFFHFVSKNLHGIYKTTTIIPLQGKLQTHIRICQRRSASDKALTPVLAPSVTPPVDILLEQLQKATSLERVMELISLHHSVMNSRQLTVAFQQLYTIVKENNINNEDITKNPSFAALCKWTMRRARFLETDEVVLVIRTLSYIGISSDTAIMQTMLQMLRYGINNLSLSQIVFTNFILSKQKTTPLVEALKMALPLVLQAQVDVQLDSDRLPEVVDCLKTLTSSSGLNSTTIQRMVEILLEKHKFLTPLQAYQVCYSLLHLRDLTKDCIQLLQLSFDIVSKNLNEIKTKQLISLLISMQRYSISSNRFFAALSKKAVAEKWDFHDLYSLLRSFISFEYVSTELLDFLAEVLINQPNLITSDKISTLTILQAFALCGYQPHQAKALWKLLSSNDEKINYLKYNYPLLFINLVSSLSVLGSCPSELLSMALNEAFLSETYVISQRRGKTSSFLKDLLLIEWSFREENLNYSEQVIPAPYLKEAIQLEAQHQNDSSPIGKCLEISLGGPQFLQENVWTKYGHKLDQVIVMRKGDYPMSLTFKEAAESANGSYGNEVKFVEDIIHPLDAKIVGIIAADEDCFCNYPPIVKGWMKLKLQTLSKLGYYPVLINLETWNNLLDREKIPYLMREISGVINQIEDFTQDASPAV